ncbi:MAG: type IV pilus modification protein PilV [Pseudomonadota bacterium]|nr:type IV pilus modification protein PilV [Pseudomonadota bacterium]
MPMISFKDHQGFSMVEVLVTLAITIIGLVGLASLQLQASRSASDTGNRSQAVWIIEDLTNRIRANTGGLENYDTGGSAYSCGTTPSKVCSAYHDGSSRRTANTSCTTADQAESDIWEMACGYGAEVSGSATTRSSAADFIANPELTIDVDTVTRQVTIDLSWDVRSSGQDSEGNSVYSGQAEVKTARAEIQTVIYP